MQIEKQDFKMFMQEFTFSYFSFFYYYSFGATGLLPPLFNKHISFK